MILAELKSRTRDHHARAEAAVNLMVPSLSTGQYGEVLRAARALHSPLERQIARELRAALDGAEWHALDWDGRLKTPLLDADLLALGLSTPADHPADHVRSEAQAWGAAYVLEGATLGGQIVCRHLRAQGFAAEHLRFYGSYGDQVGPRWRAFGALLSERQRLSPDPQAFLTGAVHAAQRTFELFTPGAGTPAPGAAHATVGAASVRA